MTTACDKKPLVKNSSDLLWKQINNFWHSSSFSPYQQRCHHYISLCPQKSFVCNYSNFAFFTHSVQDQNPFPKKKMATEATFIIFSSYDRRMCLLHTDTDMVISHVTYSVIITSILTLLIICLWHRLYCSLSKQNGVSKQLGVAQVLKPPSFCCLYFAFTGNQCLYSACV